MIASKVFQRVTDQVARRLNSAPPFPLNYQGPSLLLDFVNQQYVAGRIEDRPAAYRFSDLITFTRASGGGRFNAQGQYEWLAADQPRIDYDPVTGECLGLLIEEQRTQLNTVSASPTAAQTVTVSGVAHTISFYGTGSVSLSGAHAASLTSAGAYPARRKVTFTPTAGSLTITPTGDVRMLQLEVGSFATSAIVGEGSQVTRAADVASVNVLSPWFNASEGTLFVEASTFGSRPAWAYAQVWDGTTSNRIGITRVQSSGVTAAVNTGGVSQVATVGSDSAQIRAALAYRANDVSISRNGAVPEVDASVALPANLTQLAIGRSSGADTFLNGHIRSAKYFPRRLSDTELQAMTA